MARRAAGRHDPAEGGLLLIAWWVVPWVLAVLYQPSWPLEDALRPQRLWLIASQPGLILAAIGLVGLVEAIVAAPRSRIRRAAPLAVVLVLVASVPVTVATTRLLASTWTEPIYAHLRLGPDRVPDFAALLPSHSPRPTVLTYEDWSSLAWYETGVGVVAVVPPGYAKLAFDPAAFTGHGQADRRSDLAAAFRGDPAVLVATADRYGADRIVLARRGTTTRLLSQPAASGRCRGRGDRHVPGRRGQRLGRRRPRPGRDADDPHGHERTDRPRDPTPDAGRGPGRGPRRRFRLHAGDTTRRTLTATRSDDADFSVVTTSVDLQPGATLRLEAIDPITVQSVTGFVPDPGPPAGWSVATTTDDAIVWQRQP